MQIIESTDFGVRAAVYRVQRRFSPLQFDLYPMLHVGRPEYYAEVRRRLREADVIISEGIHPDEEPLPEEPPNNPLDLVRNPNARAQLLVAMLTAGYRAIPSDQQHGLIEQPDELDDGQTEIIRPDVSARELSDRFQTISPLRRAAALGLIGSAAIAQRLVGPRMTRYQLKHSNLDDEPTVAEILTPEWAEHFARVLVNERDEPLLATIDELIETRGKQEITVAVTYGAMHLRAVINHLYGKGFRVIDSDWITVTSWV